VLSVPILSGTYVAISAVFVLMTFFEGWAFHGGWRLQRLIGLVLGLAWPLMLLMFVLHSHLSRRKIARRTAGAARLACL
jgi:cytochrome b subunit of formate dehydrogenase